MKKMTLAFFLASLSFGTAYAVCDSSACGSLTLPQNPPVFADGGEGSCDTSFCGSLTLPQNSPTVAGCGNGDCEPGTKTQTLTPAQMKNLVADSCTGDYCNDGGGVRG